MSTFIKNTSPTIAKRIEKDIANEAVKEDKSVKHALKELAHLEKQDNKAHKKVDKGTRALGKADQKEESTLHALNKQTKRHDDAVVELSCRSRELEALKAQEAKLDAALAQKKIIVEDVACSRIAFDGLRKQAASEMPTTLQCRRLRTRIQRSTPILASCTDDVGAGF